MSFIHHSTELLFSYGTLQNIDVQQQTFGRELAGYEDTLLAYKLAMVDIGNQSVVELSGEKTHPIAVYTGNQTDKIAGKVFAITPTELRHSDEYEVDAYRRVKAEMASGAQVWAYVSCAD
jgi:gamma-glutamylcyclotransferase (GGCT)/AIG2-like uncharacterized protein YtfP